MPRAPRARTESGIHHVVVQGPRKRTIFSGKEKKDLYLDILLRYRARFEMELYAYCILENHCHILLREGMTDVSGFMRRVGVSYSYWYKKQEGATGAVFRGRYRSEPLEESNVRKLIQYIQEEPVHCGFVEHPEDYRWGSARRQSLRKEELICAERPRYYASGLARADSGFLEEVPAKFGRNREEVEQALEKRLGSKDPTVIAGLSREERDNLLRALRYEDEISIHLVSEVTGIGRGVVQRVRRLSS